MTEIWLPIADTLGAYEVSSLGRVRSLDREVGHRWGGVAVKRGKVLKPRVDKDGYLFVTLYGRGFGIHGKLHRLVAAAFLPPSALPEVNHQDLDKTNNAATNLEWSSRKGNQEHASDSGLFAARSNPKRAKKMTPESVDSLRSDRAQLGMTFAALGEKYGISGPTACRIFKGEVWK